MSERTLNINEDLVRRFTVQGIRPSDGVMVDATALSFEVRIAATRDGDAIGSLTVGALEYSGDPGFYHADFATASLVAELTDYLWHPVYVIVKEVGKVDCIWWAYTVTNHRAAL